ncbi:MAG: hypothetical protein L6416_03450 [Candidatus Omnitrophica bacterium]|nr:hypothetical protein [Candidatus Omnitrophota bacterium]
MKNKILKLSSIIVLTVFMINSLFPVPLLALAERVVPMCWNNGIKMPALGGS